MVTGGCISRFQSLIVIRADLQSRFVNTEPTAENRFVVVVVVFSGAGIPCTTFRH